MGRRWYRLHESRQLPLTPRSRTPWRSTEGPAMAWQIGDARLPPLLAGEGWGGGKSRRERRVAQDEQRAQKWSPRQLLCSCLPPEGAQGNSGRPSVSLAGWRGLSELRSGAQRRKRASSEAKPSPASREGAPLLSGRRRCDKPSHPRTPSPSKRTRFRRSARPHQPNSPSPLQGSINAPHSRPDNDRLTSPAPKPHAHFRTPKPQLGAPTHFASTCAPPRTHGGHQASFRCKPLPPQAAS
jgi:hypothetical protein